MSQSSPLARLWSHARHALTALCASLMPLDTLLAREQSRLRTWLRALEGFCRRLALTEALALVRAGWERSLRMRSAHLSAGKKRPALRLWPKFKRVKPRIRVLGAPSSVRELQAEQQRMALAARLAVGRLRAKPPHLRLADRIEALQRFLDAPLGAIRRFALKLRATPCLAHAIVARPAPACPFLAADQVRDNEILCYDTVACDSS